MQLSHALAGSEPDELRRLVHLEAEDGFVYPVSPHISPYLPVSPHVSGPRSGTHVRVPQPALERTRTPRHSTAFRCLRLCSHPSSPRGALSRLHNTSNLHVRVRSAQALSRLECGARARRHAAARRPRGCARRAAAGLRPDWARPALHEGACGPRRRERMTRLLVPRSPGVCCARARGPRRAAAPPRSGARPTRSCLPEGSSCTLRRAARSTRRAPARDARGCCCRRWSAPSPGFGSPPPLISECRHSRRPHSPGDRRRLFRGGPRPRRAARRARAAAAAGGGGRERVAEQAAAGGGARRAGVGRGRRAGWRRAQPDRAARRRRAAAAAARLAFAEARATHPDPNHTPNPNPPGPSPNPATPTRTTARTRTPPALAPTPNLTRTTARTYPGA